MLHVSLSTRGNRFTSMRQQRDTNPDVELAVTPGGGAISKELKISKMPRGLQLRSPVEEAQASTLNNIPREFIPPALRSYDPHSQRKRRGPGRPRAGDNPNVELFVCVWTRVRRCRADETALVWADTEEAEDGNRLNDWEMVKKGGGLDNNPQVSPFDAMIAADEAEEERLGLSKRKRGRAKKSTSVAAAKKVRLPPRHGKIHQKSVALC